MNRDCVFCKIVSGEIPSKKIYEDDTVYVFEDINPVTPIHWLFVPKKHLSGAGEITSENSDAVAKIFETAASLANEHAVGDYRIVTNCGKGAGQTVFHLHFHLLAGRQLGEMV
ncbi:MAG: histidine triad nucleotide-binding protein [Oscillospiraceae bacterium]|jgi:histidine triad (HIT) family protein|nr:histidine triad nucleotide-binding protein [Oscillospiraceae bacterium]